MKKAFAAILVVSLISIASFCSIQPARAAINSIGWIKPVWKDRTGLNADAMLGDVLIGYVNGSQWMLNVRVTNDATNGTHNMDAHIYKIAVWFDWNQFYNTTVDVTLKYGADYLFTITGNTEQPSVASNLFTHSYKVYVEYDITFLSDGAVLTSKKSWGPSNGDKFAVITQEQHDSWQASNDWNFLYDEMHDLADDYAESEIILIQARQEANMGATSYKLGQFTSASSHYGNAMSLLNQSYSIANSMDIQYDEADLREYQADADLAVAEAKAVDANATARLIEANALATATVVNSFAFIFFGLGFMFFGVGAIVYAYKRSQRLPKE